MSKNHVIDLRSDTVTKPSPAMRAALAAAEVGDDVFGDDPTVNALEARAAQMLGKDEALFVPSGTQANLLAVTSHCQRGDEYIAGQTAHTYKYEAGGAAVVGGVQPQPIEFEPDGSLDLAKVAAKIKPDDSHFARTRLLCLENTQSGKVLSVEYHRRAAEFARAHGLALHLDGARIFNAAVKLGVPVTDIARHADTVTCCLSKGLGAPVGSMLCGPRDLIARARRTRKLLGGGMRQAGILAAAGLYALEHNVARLAEDHENASKLARGLASITGLRVDMQNVQTNMVFVECAPAWAKALAAFLGERGILILDGTPLRLVTHLDVTSEDMDATINAFQAFPSCRAALRGSVRTGGKTARRGAPEKSGDASPHSKAPAARTGSRSV